MSELNPKDKNTEPLLCVCGNCRAKHHVNELNDIKRYHERVAPGETVPAGECPDCGCLSHYIDESLHETEPDEDDEDDEDNSPTRFMAYWGNGEDSRDGDETHEREFATFEEARDFIIAQLEDVQIGYHGSDTERLARMIQDEYRDVTMDFETVRVGGFTYSVSGE